MMIPSVRRGLQFAVAASVAMVLSGCGGGGGTKPEPPKPPKPPKPIINGPEIVSLGACMVGTGVSELQSCGYGDMLVFEIGEDGTVGDGVTCADGVCTDDENNFQAVMIDDEWRIVAIPREDGSRMSTPFTHVAEYSETAEYRLAIVDAAGRIPNRDVVTDPNNPMDVSNPHAVVMDSDGKPESNFTVDVRGNAEGEITRYMILGAPNGTTVDSDMDEVLLRSHGDGANGVAWNGIELRTDGSGGQPAGTLWTSIYTDFTPDDQGNDADYLAGGIWLFASSDPNVSDPFSVGAFMYGGMWYSGNLTDHAVNNLGEVTYVGDARGIRSSGNGTSVFEGEANLTAEFRDSLVAGNQVGVIGGLIRIGDSELTLVDSPITDDGAGGIFHGQTEMGSLAGSWGGRFFGPDDSQGPGAAAGTFGAADVDETILGTFMTYRQDGN